MIDEEMKNIRSDLIAHISQAIRDTIKLRTRLHEIKECDYIHTSPYHDTFVDNVNTTQGELEYTLGQLTGSPIGRTRHD